MRFLSSFTTLADKELRVLLRDPQALGLLFGMPALLVFLLSLALKDVYNEKVGSQLTVILEVEDDGEAARTVEESLREGGNLVIVERPEGRTNRQIFRSGDARAVVHIPVGFSDAAEEFVATRGTSGFGETRIEWEASPTLDAPYRRYLEAQLAILCLEYVQAELVRGTEELGEQLEEMGAEMGSMGEEMESMGETMDTMGSDMGLMGDVLEDTLAQLANTTALLKGDRNRLIDVAKADALDNAARREAENLRAELEAQGMLLPGGEQIAEGGGTEDAANPATIIQRELIDYTDGVELERPDNPALARLEEMRAEREPRTRDPRLPREISSMDFVRSDESLGLELFLEESTGERARLPTPLQQTVPGWSLFAMFFVVVPLSQGLHRERAEGTLRRMLSLAVSRTSIILGKLAPYVLIGTLQFGGMVLVGLFAVPAVSDLSLEFGREPWVLIPITLAASLAASSYGLLVASLTKTPEQASAFGATSVVILSVVSGIMVPHFMMPELLQKVAYASPLYWGQKAYLDAFLHDAGIREVAPSLYILVGFAFLCVLIASRRVALRS
ncbi:MAG: ABC-type multidrug transport system permease subunit [Planctomycetota bacterium]|jgi:ABC-type multidrug transport system permease subunit